MIGNNGWSKMLSPRWSFVISCADDMVVTIKGIRKGIITGLYATCLEFITKLQRF